MLTLVHNISDPNPSSKWEDSLHHYKCLPHALMSILLPHLGTILWFRHDYNAAVHVVQRTVLNCGLNKASLSANGRCIIALHVLEGCLYLGSGYTGLTACELFCLPEYIHCRSQQIRRTYRLVHEDWRAVTTVTSVAFVKRRLWRRTWTWIIRNLELVIRTLDPSRCLVFGYEAGDSRPLAPRCCVLL